MKPRMMRPSPGCRARIGPNRKGFGNPGHELAFLDDPKGAPSNLPAQEVCGPELPFFMAESRKLACPGFPALPDRLPATRAASAFRAWKRFGSIGYSTKTADTTYT